MPHSPFPSTTCETATINSIITPCLHLPLLCPPSLCCIHFCEPKQKLNSRDNLVEVYHICVLHAFSYWDGYVTTFSLNLQHLFPLSYSADDLPFNFIVNIVEIIKRRVHPIPTVHFPPAYIRVQGISSPFSLYGISDPSKCRTLPLRSRSQPLSFTQGYGPRDSLDIHYQPTNILLLPASLKNFSLISLYLSAIAPFLLFFLQQKSLENLSVLSVSNFPTLILS